MASKVYKPLNNKRKKNIRENFSNPMEVGESQTQQDTDKNNWGTFTKWVVGDFATTLFITLVGTNMVFFTMLPSKYQDQLFPTDRDKCPYARNGCPPKCGISNEQQGGSSTEKITIVNLSGTDTDTDSYMDVRTTLFDEAKQDSTSVTGDSTSVGVAADATNKMKDMFSSLNVKDVANKEPISVGGGGKISSAAKLIKGKKNKVLLYDSATEPGNTRGKNRTLSTAITAANDTLKHKIKTDKDIWDVLPTDTEPGTLNPVALSNSGIDMACENTDADKNVLYSLPSTDTSWKNLKKKMKSIQTGNHAITLQEASQTNPDDGVVVDYLINTLNINPATKLSDIEFKNWSAIQDDELLKNLTEQIVELEGDSEEKLLDANYRFMVEPAFWMKELTDDNRPCEARKIRIQNIIKKNPSGKTFPQRASAAAKPVVSGIGRALKDTGSAVASGVNAIVGAVLPMNKALNVWAKGVDNAGDVARTGAEALLIEANAKATTANAAAAAAGVTTNSGNQTGGGSCPPGAPNAEYECRDWASMFSKQNSATCRAVDDFTEEWMCWDWPYKWISPPVTSSADASRKSQGFVDTIFSTQKYNTTSTGDSMKTFCGCAFSEYWIFIRAIFKWFLRLFKRDDGSAVNPLAADIFPIIIGFFIIVPLVLSGFVHFLAYAYSGLKNIINLFYDLGAGWVIKGKFSILWIFILFFVMSPLWMIVGSMYGIVISPVRMMFTLLFVPWLISSRMCKDIVKCNISTFMMIFGALVVKSAYLSLTKDSFTMMAILYIILSGYNLFSTRTSAGKG